jgi:hypothetical protein
MEITSCFNHNCHNNISLLLPRKLYTLHRNFSIRYKLVDNLIVNYKYENESTSTLWVPTKDRSIVKYRPFCSKRCLENYLLYENKKDDLKRVIIYDSYY